MINEEKLQMQKDAFEALKKNNFRAGVVLPTGSGKTKVMIDCLKELFDDGISILYCCDNRNLRDEDFPNELKKWEADKFIPFMDRLCYQSAYKLTGQHYTILLLDEGDYALTPQYIKLLENNEFDYIILVSATLEDEKRSRLERFIPIVYEKKMHDLDGKGIVNKANIYAVQYMLSAEENRKYLSFNDLFKRELNKDKRNLFALQMAQQGRKRFLGQLISSQKVCNKLMKKLYLEDDNNKILIFCLLSQQADDICKYSYHSKNAKDNDFLRMFDDGEIRILSVVGKIDRGVNLNGVNKVIFEAPMESKTKFIQKGGRARRLDVEQEADFYFLIPFYKDRRGNYQPTVVQKWVLNSIKDLNQELKIYKL